MKFCAQVLVTMNDNSSCSPHSLMAADEEEVAYRVKHALGCSFLAVAEVVVPYWDLDRNLLDLNTPMDVVLLGS